jgi:hypothetical protein
MDALSARDRALDVAGLLHLGRGWTAPEAYCLLLDRLTPRASRAGTHVQSPENNS